MEGSDQNNTLTNGEKTEWRNLDSDYVYNNLMILWTLVWILIIALGLWTNALIIRTFLRMGLSDSITISFFVLAVSDFAHVLVPLASVVAVFLTYIETMFAFVFPIQPQMVYIFSINQGVSLNSFSAFIITYLAVQRCLCIVKPLHFKDMFTKARTWAIMVVLGTISSITLVSYSFGYKSVYAIDPTVNASRYIIGITTDYNAINFFMQAFYLFELISSHVLILGSMVVMGYALKASVTFRSQISTGNKAIQKSNVGHVGKKENPNKMKNESKERVVIMQVSLLLCIFIITNIPKIAVIVGNILLTDEKQGGAPGNILVILGNIRFTFDYINSSINLPIYYKYNTKFRNLCFADKSQRDQSCKISMVTEFRQRRQSKES